MEPDTTRCDTRKGDTLKNGREKTKYPTKSNSCVHGEWAGLCIQRIRTEAVKTKEKGIVSYLASDAQWVNTVSLAYERCKAQQGAQRSHTSPPKTQPRSWALGGGLEMQGIYTSIKSLVRGAPPEGPKRGGPFYLIWDTWPSSLVVAPG